MQSKTSFSKGGWFSPTLYRKDLSRFWPLWAAYGAVWVFSAAASSFLTLFGYGYGWDQSSRFDTVVWDLGSLVETASLVSVCFGCLFAMALFSYLNAPRSVGFAHALPLRREGHFLTHYAAGVSMFLAVHLLTLGLTAAVWAAAGVPNLLLLWVWFLTVTGEMLFFFSLGSFCALFAGQLLAVPVFYAALNGLALFLFYMLQGLSETFFYGFAGYGIPAAVEWLTPVMNLLGRVSPHLTYDSALNFTAFSGVAGLGVVGVYALAGLLLAAAALAVNRFRRSESAGEVVAVGWARPLFRFGVALCAALSLGQLLYYLLWDSFSLGRSGVSVPALAVCMILTGLLGYYAAEMLLEKSFRVFKKSWKEAAALSAALVLLCAGLSADVFGVERRVPDPGQVASLSLRSYSGGGSLNATFSPEDLASIEKLVGLHRAIVADLPALSLRAPSDWADGSGGDSLYSTELYLTYELANGSSLRRNYSIFYSDADLAAPGSLLRQVADLLADPAIQLAGLPDREALRRVTGGQLEVYAGFSPQNDWATEELTLSAAAAETLLDAFYRDVAAGHAGLDALSGGAWAENAYANSLCIFYLQENGDAGDSFNSVGLNLSFSAHYTYLLAALDQLGVPRDQLCTYAQRQAEKSAYYDGDEPAALDPLYEAGVRFPQETVEVPALPAGGPILDGADLPAAVLVS